MSDNNPAEMKQRFEDDGYLIISDVLSEQVIADLCDEIVELSLKALVSGTLATGMTGAVVGMMPFL